MTGAPKVWLQTLGCAKNQVDSYKLEAQISEAGYEWTQDIDEAAAEAKFRDGVLELTLPKKAAAARKQIAIN